MPIDPKWKAMSEKTSIYLAAIAMLVTEALLSLVVARLWRGLPLLSRFNLIYFGVIFAILWLFQLRETRKQTRLGLTSLAFIGAMWVILTIGTSH